MTGAVDGTQRRLHPSIGTGDGKTQLELQPMRSAGRVPSVNGTVPGTRTTAAASTGADGSNRSDGTTAGTATGAVAGSVAMIAVAMLIAVADPGSCQK